MPRPSPAGPPDEPPAGALSSAGGFAESYWQPPGLRAELSAEGTCRRKRRSAFMLALRRPRKSTWNALRLVRQRPSDRRGPALIEKMETCRRAYQRVAWDLASPEDCRRQARRCEALAGATRNDISREAYLRVALCWRTAAAQLESRKS
jgi:hypothetical protein